jgi:oligosaccharide repeat unit polymerase
MGTLSLNQIGKTFERLRLWVAGYIPAFNGWLWSSWNGHLTWGSSTFRFLSQLTSNKAGALTEVGSDIYVGNYTYGNACTSLKGVVNDFGLVGCGIFLFVWGVLSRAVLTQARRGSIVWGVFFACDLAAIVWSPNAFFFMYGSRVLAPALALAYIGFRRLRLRLPAKSRLIDAKGAGQRRQSPNTADAWRSRNSNRISTRPRL